MSSSSPLVVAFIQTLSDPRRLRLMTLLAQAPRSTAALADLVGVSAADTDKALRRLRDAGLVAAAGDTDAPDETTLGAVAAALAALIPPDDGPTEPPLAFETVLAALQTLNRPPALAVLAAFGQGSANAEAVALASDLPLPQVDDMLARLNALGLAEVSGDPGRYVYRLRAGWLRDLPLTLARVAPPTGGATVAAPPTPEDFEQKTLRDFVVNGRLKTIPSQEKKREVILRYLADLFEPQREYPEREVNAILRDVHPDAASLRRYLVDSHLMQRDHGVYWRTQP
ncbi:MAG: DUF2087 domain-containing protein [Anaerolineae bacterium]